MSASSEDDDLGLEASAVAPTWPEPEFELILRKPLTSKDGSEIACILLREPTGAEWEEIFDQPAKIRRRFAISRIGGVPMADCAKIGIGDLVLGEAYLNSFFDVAQARGSKLSG